MDKLIMESAQNGSVEAIIAVAKAFYDNSESENNRGEAATWYKKALDINENEVRALNGLGNCYYNGIGVERNRNKALDYYRKAAELGFVNSQYNLANELKENNDPECIEWFEKAYSQGDADAPYDMAWIYKDGKVAPQDDQKYIDYLQKAVELNNYMAYTDLAFEYLEGGIIEKDIKKGRALLETAAENGNSVAASNLSVMYVKGDGVEKNIKTAIEWAKKAADLGYDEQLFALGVDLFEGKNNLDKDQILALDCFVYAANLGNITAMSNAGVCYSNGYGTLVDKDRAIEYFEKAVSAGSADDIGKLKQIYSDEPDHPNGNWLESFLKKEASNDNCVAIGALAFMYAHGQLVEKNQAKALVLYKKGANLNDGYCCYFLAGCLLTGKLGVQKNPEEATDYLFKEKKLGHLPSICMLAECYADGEGVEKNPALAFDLYMEAAEQGSAEAQFQVYNAYENGIGVTEDKQLANEWLDKAAGNGHELALGLKGLYARLDGDSALAAEYWEKAVQTGNLKITYDLAELYLTGEENLSENKERAIELHRRNAERGYAPSQVSLGVCYRLGDGIDVDLVKSTEWFKKAAEQGDMYGQQNYAIALREGRGVTPNPSAAFEYFTKAAAQGSAQSKLCLAKMLYTGEGTVKDANKAVQIYNELLSDTNNKYHSEVKAILAEIYIHEYHDYDSAFKLYNELAKEGDVQGIGCLAICYYNGWGTTRDIEQAMRLMEIAAESDTKAQETLARWRSELKYTSMSTSSSVPTSSIPSQPNQSQANTSKNGCYIATCVYGSYNCPEVWTLRRFRDNCLSHRVCGRAFIRVYYAISPILVKLFGDTAAFQRVWKCILNKMVKKLKSEGYSDLPYDDAIKRN